MDELSSVLAHATAELQSVSSVLATLDNRTGNAAPQEPPQASLNPPKHSSEAGRISISFTATSVPKSPFVSLLTEPSTGHHRSSLTGAAVSNGPHTHLSSPLISSYSGVSPTGGSQYGDTSKIQAFSAASSREALVSPVIQRLFLIS